MSGSSLPHSEKRVAIIGAGVSGLQAARALQKHGVRFKVFEAYDDVAGVWRANYTTYKAQVHTHFYEFPEFPYPPEYKLADTDLPDGTLIYDYCCAYVDKYNLRKHIQFETRFLRLELVDPSDDNSGWWVIYKHGREEEQREAFDFVIVATGVNAIPAMPEDYKTRIIAELQDLGKFEGVLLPARYADDPSLIANKKVLIIGGNKTAMSVAEACEKLQADTTVLFRRAHWPIPEYTLGIIPVHQWFMRLTKIALPGYYTQRGMMRTLHQLLQPVKDLIWFLLRWAYHSTLGLFGDLIPDIDPLDDIYICGTYIATRRLFDLMKAGRIKPVKGDVDRFTKDGVILRTGQPLSGFDVILTALGYYRDYSFLPPDMRSRLDIEEDGLWLFRHMISPKIPGLAFVGGEIVTNDGILTLGIQGEWVARVIAGKLRLPSVEDQLADIAAAKEWKRSWMRPSTRRSQMMMQHDSYYRDQLIRDTGYSIYMHGLSPLKIGREFLYPPESCIWQKFFLAAEEETQGKRMPPKSKVQTVRPLKASSLEPLEKIEVKSGGRPVSELMEKGVLKHPLDSVGMPVLRTVRGIKYGTSARKKASDNSQAAAVPQNCQIPVTKEE